MNLLLTRVCSFLLFLGLGDIASAQLAGMSREASITYEGSEIFEFRFTSPTKCADTAWFSSLYVATTRLIPTEYFSKEMGAVDDEGWLVIKNESADNPLAGKLKLRGDGAGSTWIGEIRVRKRDTPVAGRTTWMLDFKSLDGVNKKRFVGRRIVPFLTEPRSLGVNSDGQWIYPEESDIPIVLTKREVTINLLKGYLPVLQGILETEINDPDQLWKFCIHEVLQQRVKFQKTEHAVKQLPLQQGSSGDADKITLKNSDDARLFVHVEGLGISFQEQIVLHRVKMDENSLWVIASADRLNEEQWAIRRSLVPDLAEVSEQENVPEARTIK